LNRLPSNVGLAEGIAVGVADGEGVALRGGVAATVLVGVAVATGDGVDADGVGGVFVALGGRHSLRDRLFIASGK
jgi:hypothetical protein